MSTDTTKLLKECDAGVKMAIKNLDDIIKHVSDPDLKSMIEESRKVHVELKSETEEMLKNSAEDEKEPNIMAQGMSYLKTNVKVSMEKTDETVADLLTDGCNMGIKSLFRYLNKYKAADESAKELCGRLIKTEEKLLTMIRPYL